MASLSLAWTIGIVVIVFIASVLSGLVLFALFHLALDPILARYKKSGSGPSGPSGPLIFMPKLIRRVEHLAFLEDEDALASLPVIGHGGCGDVYKAQLPVELEGAEQARLIAIKKIQSDGGNIPSGNLSPSDMESQQPGLGMLSRQILSEIRTVGHIRHRNLLPLAAYVKRQDCHFLVYEYMKNGSLEKALRPRDGGGSNTGVVLSWPARLRVAVGIAEGLQYLHVSHRPQIIHRDLKPDNVLLDDNLEPRIADFGLARAIPGTGTQTEPAWTHAAGTFGYIAPEHYHYGFLTAKCDIYAFGMILAKLVTGKGPWEVEGGMATWLRGVMQSAGDHAEVIDPAIAGSGYDEQIMLVLRIAIFCTSFYPRHRPSAKDARCMLSQVQRRPQGPAQQGQGCHQVHPVPVIYLISHPAVPGEEIV